MYIYIICMYNEYVNDCKCIFRFGCMSCIHMSVFPYLDFLSGDLFFCDVATIYPSVSILTMGLSKNHAPQKFMATSFFHDFERMKGM